MADVTFMQVTAQRVVDFGPGGLGNLIQQFPSSWRQPAVARTRGLGEAVGEDPAVLSRRHISHLNHEFVEQESPLVANSEIESGL